MIKNKYNQHKKLIENITWRALQVAGKQGLTFLIFILCAKLLDPYDFGIYNYILAIIFFLIMFGDFGISTAVSKYVVEYKLKNKEKLKSVIFNSSLIILAVDLIIVILTLLIGPIYLKENYIYIIYLLPLVFLAPMTSLYDGIYRGLNKFKQLAIISLIMGVVSIFFVYILINKYGLMGALISQNLFYLVLLVALGLNHRDLNFKINKEVIKEISKYSLFIGVSATGYFFFTRVGTIVLGHFGYISEIGYYEIINKLFFLFLLPFTIFSQVIATKITSLNYQNNKSAIKNKFIKYFFFTIITSTILAILVYLMPPSFIKYLLARYDPIILIKFLKIVLIVLVTQSVSTLVALGFSNPMGHAKINMYLLIIFGLLSVLINIILIKAYGLIGSMYSFLLVRSLYDVSLTFIYYKLKIINI